MAATFGQFPANLRFSGALLDTLFYALHLPQRIMPYTCNTPLCPIKKQKMGVQDMDGPIQDPKNLVLCPTPTIDVYSVNLPHCFISYTGNNACGPPLHTAANSLHSFVIQLLSHSLTHCFGQ